MNKLAVEEQKQYYDELWSSRITSKPCEDERCRERFIIGAVKQLSLKSGRKPKVMDLGCGRGRITNLLSKYSDVVGVDLSPHTAQKLYPHLRFIQANIAADKIDGKYDIVVSTEVIEHLTVEDQALYVQKASELLVDGGYLILTTPNGPVARGLNIPPEQLQPIENWFDKESLQSLLSPYFRILFAGSVMFHPNYLRRHSLTEMVYGLLVYRSRVYRLVNRLLKKTSYGLYLTVIAQKI